MNTLTTLPTAQQITDRLAGAQADLCVIARDIVQVINVNPKFTDELVKLGNNRLVIHALERLGRNQVHPQLVFATTPGGQRLAKLTLGEQVRILADGVEILEGDGEDIRLIHVHELSAAQAAQVFSRGIVRSLAQQRTWIRECKAKVIPKLPDTTIRHTREYTYIPGLGKVSRAQLLNWLANMEGSR